MNQATGPRATDFETGYRAEFAVGEHSARHLRRILRLYLSGSGLSELADAAELALTEVVGNVVRHVPDRRCSICFLFRPEGVRVEVADSFARRPARRVGDLLADGGRGLLLVETVADRWGVAPRPSGAGKTVWFECLTKTPDVERDRALSACGE
ncbi:anti-sigma regulatory factor (Ser/Thr protein kinase) [Streptomyces achromogenes]|uniref:ATP-binding protein n=1 Tax=Streptomyces achromogenes TaxID=67255 RepID=UPI00277E7D01|nr:ATP-binding protein [Streptomyces achromogenes]MDQ0830719.1 anti-sigma regulatory factor (Ser/Thr protein kinase) [Streptomyces achromogenes]